MRAMYGNGPPPYVFAPPSPDGPHRAGGVAVGGSGSGSNQRDPTIHRLNPHAQPFAPSQVPTLIPMDTGVHAPPLAAQAVWDASSAQWTAWWAGPMCPDGHGILSDGTRAACQKKSNARRYTYACKHCGKWFDQMRPNQLVPGTDRDARWRPDLGRDGRCAIPPPARDGSDTATEEALPSFGETPLAA